MQAPAKLHAKWRKVYPEFDDTIGTYRAGPDEACPDVVNPIAGFAAMMENHDNQIGELLAILVELGVDENTIVLFSSGQWAPTRKAVTNRIFGTPMVPFAGSSAMSLKVGIRTPFPRALARCGPRRQHERATSARFRISCRRWRRLSDSRDPEQTDGISMVPTFLDVGGQEMHPYLYFEFIRVGAETLLISRPPLWPLGKSSSSRKRDKVEPSCRSNSTI